MSTIVTYIELETPEFSSSAGGDKRVEGVEYDFDDGSAHGWTGDDVTLTPGSDGLAVVPTGADPRFESQSGIGVPGSVYRYILIDVERTKVRSSGVWEGKIYYATSGDDGHGYDEAFRKFFDELPNEVGARQVYVLDMHDLADGGDDWATSTIDQIRIDLEQGSGVDGEFLLHSVKIGPRIQTWRFAEPSEDLPRDIDCIPSITSVGYSAAIVSLGEGLGQRATLTVTFRDHRHQMASEPFESGTFWGKWRARYGQKLRGCDIRLIRGQAGQPIESMETRHLFVESTDGPTPAGVYTIIAKDLLKFADDERAKAPRLSNGKLLASIDDNDLSATLNPTGIGDEEYPAAPFYLCLGGKEIVHVTARTGDALTIVRGQLGSAAIAHDAGDRAQLVLHYEGNTFADIIADLFTAYAAIDGETIPLSEWQAEAADVGDILYARAITEPTGVTELVSELIEQAGLMCWYDDLSRTIKLKALKEIATNAALFDDDTIIEGSLDVREQPDKRASEVWTTFSQRNPADRGDNEDNYRFALATIDADSIEEYGGTIIRQLKGSWLPTLGSAEHINSVVLSRFRDPPRQFRFTLDAAAQVLAGLGYRLRWRANQDIEGNVVEDGAPIQVTRVTPEPGLLRVEAEEMLISDEEVGSVTNYVFLLTTGSVLTWQVPDDWNDADNSVHCIGGGGRGAPPPATIIGGSGGGGGAYSSAENLALSASPMPAISYRVGAGGITGSIDGGDTWFGGASLGAALVGAKGGTGATTAADLSLSGSNPGTGGAAASGVGTLRTSGGTGGHRFAGEHASGGGGGAAGGPNGDGAGGGNAGGGGGGGGGADGGATGSNGTATVGGSGGANRLGYGGGNSTVAQGLDGGGGRGGDRNVDTAGAGGPGEALWTQTVAPIITAGPGGGGGGGGSGGSGRAGGLFGGGGGGGSRGIPTPGDGAQGVIVIRWRPA